MARIEMAHAKETVAQRRDGVEAFRKVAVEVKHISQMQLDDALLARLGQGANKPVTGEKPDFVFYTGCNVLKTPHIALLALDIMDSIGVTYEVMGGPTHCCGIVQMRMGDVATSGRFGEATIDKLSHSKSGQVVSWCPSCQVQFTETTLPTLEKTRGAKPFEMTPFTLFLHKKLDRLRPLLARARADADRAASPSRHSWRRRGRRGYFARRARHRDRRLAAAGGRAAKQ